MWPFPKLLQIWREPKEFAQAAYTFAENNAVPWLRPALLAAMIGVVLLGWYAARFDPAKDPVSFPVAIGIGLLSGIILVYVFPYVFSLSNRFRPSEVLIRTKNIMRLQGNSASEISLKAISSYYWLSHEDFIILAVLTNRKQPTVFGVPDAETKQKIENVLGSLGIPQSNAEPDDRTDAADYTGGRDE